MDKMWWAAGGIVLIALVMAGRRVVSPLWLLRQAVAKAGLGLLFLLVVDAAGAFFAFNLPINFATIGIAGLLGAPGVALIAYMCYIIT
ncbi:MAG: pro-sigmaK processing inhibitor BofA family protein [Ignavibacteriales bacterium]